MVKKRMLTLLLSLAMLLTFVPATVFAEDDADNNSGQPAAAETFEEAVVEDTDVEEPSAEAVTEPKEALNEAEEAVEAAEEPKVLSLEYTGPTLYFESASGPKSVDPWVDEVTFTITYSNGKKDIALQEYSKEGDPDDYYGFFPVGEKPAFDSEKNPLNAIDFWFDFENADDEKGLPVSYGDATTYIPIAENVYYLPVKVKFVPAGDFVAKSQIGENELSAYNYYGEGNKFVVTWTCGYETEEREYIFAQEDGDYGFVNKSADRNEWFWPEIHLDKRIVNGTADYTGTVYAEDEQGNIVEVDGFNTRVLAETYKAYVEYKSYNFTGKNIKPKIIVKYYDGTKMKKMPAKWYTCKPKKQKKIGSYTVTVKIKKNYQAKYGKSLLGYWDIRPKTPTIKKVTSGKAGTNSLTVTWTKFSKKAQKGIDGFTIQVSTDKSFDDWVDAEAKKGASKATVKNLKAGKTYYVRILTHKAVSKNEYPWWSKPSKVKSVKVQ